MDEYKFLKRTPELIAQRRVALDRYASIAQISQIVIHLSISALAIYTRGKKPKGTPTRQDQGNTLGRAVRQLQNVLGTEVTKGSGTRGQWIFGIAWAVWLGYLCIIETAPDYLHLTKRFGLIAASQLPIHYLLATSRELSLSTSLNLALHKVTGKIIIALFALHVAFYTYFFVQLGIFWNTIKNSNIAVALISAGILAILGLTSIHSFRRRNYWWFYRIHVVGSAVVLPLLFFHVVSIRVYLFESTAVLVLNAVARILRSRPKHN